MKKNYRWRHHWNIWHLSVKTKIPPLFGRSQVSNECQKVHRNIYIQICWVIALILSQNWRIYEILWNISHFWWLLEVFWRSFNYGYESNIICKIFFGFFDIHNVPKGIQISNERNTFDSSLCAMLCNRNRPTCFRKGSLLVKHLSNFVPLSWKHHNRYYHSVHCM